MRSIKLRHLMLFLTQSLAIALVILLTSPSWATTYYIGSDVSDDYASYTSFRAAVTEAAGDTVSFRKGEIFRESITVPASGTAGNPITYTSHGTGNNPKLYKSDQYSNWWLHGLLPNGGLEKYATNNFVTWVETVSGTSTVTADTTITHSGLTSAKLTVTDASCSGSLFATSCSNISINTSNAANSTSYTFSAWGRKSTADSDNSLVIRIKDVGNTKYLDNAGSWQTAATTIALDWDGEAQNTWVQKSITFTSAGSSTSYYTVSIYNFKTGTYSNVDDVHLTTENDTVRIWAGSLGATYDSKYYGAMTDSTTRLPYQSEAALSSSLGYFNGVTDFYYRNDSTTPGTVELGTRSNGIWIDDKDYIVIDGIDVYGPASTINTSTTDCAGFGGNSCIMASVLIENGSTNITVKNSTFSYGGLAYGVMATTTTENVTFDNLHVYGNAGTGIFNNSDTGVISNCTVHDNGKVATDTGDRGGIGVYQGNNSTVTRNEVYSNSQADSDGDMELSVVAQTGAATITQNYLHDCIQGCLQLTEGGDNSIIAYNKIDTFATSTSPSSSSGINSGIRVGGGSSTPDAVQIYNNTIANGGAAGTGTAAIAFPLASGDGATGAKVKNNIFYNNGSPDIVVGNFTTTAVEFSNNNYYKADFTGSFVFKGTRYDSLSAWQGAVDFATKDVNSVVTNPLFTSSTNFRLLPGSPAINAGQDVSLASDIEGRSIPLWGLPDIGAYEYAPGQHLRTTKPGRTPIQ